MLTQIKGLHHVTSMAANAQENNDFFTKTLGLRRVKKNGNFDAPGRRSPLCRRRRVGNAGSVMTYFLRQNRGARYGSGEVAETVFSVPRGQHPALLAGTPDQGRRGRPGAGRSSSARSGCALPAPTATAFRWPRHWRQPYAVPWRHGVEGRRHPRFPRRDHAAARRRRNRRTADLHGLPAGRPPRRHDPLCHPRRQRRRHRRPRSPSGARAPRLPGAGSVHHVAFSVEDRKVAQLGAMGPQGAARHRLQRHAGHRPRLLLGDHFRTPGGVLFEIATNEPGFDRDEDTAHLGEALKLPTRYQPYRSKPRRTCRKSGTDVSGAGSTGRPPPPPVQGKPHHVTS